MRRPHGSVAAPWVSYRDRADELGSAVSSVGAGEAGRSTPATPKPATSTLEPVSLEPVTPEPALSEAARPARLLRWCRDRCSDPS
jgi:hypothetical protein